MRTLRSALCGALALAVISTPGASRADDAAGSAAVNVHLQAARRLYNTLNLEAAMAELKDAEADARARSDEDEIVQILILKGMIFADNGKPTEMDDHFKRALAMRPWAEVPPDVSPRLSKKFNDARKELWGSGGQLKAPPVKKRTTAKAEAKPAAPAPAAAPAPDAALTPPDAPPAAAPAEAPAAPAETPAPAAAPEPAPAAPAGGELTPPK